jgi:hypothetical protein
MLSPTSSIPESEFLDGDRFESLGTSIPGVTYLKIDTARDYVSSGISLCPPGTVLVTHNGDYHVTDAMAEYARATGVTRWFAQNSSTEDPLVIPIPIGLERARWFPHLHKRDVLVSGMATQGAILPSKLCLSNFSLSTNYVERSTCLKAGRSYSTTHEASSVTQDVYHWYVNEVLDHHFVLCPNGNGIDTHRLWETLYLGRVPVVTSSVPVRAFSDLPILILDSWEQLSSDRLNGYLTGLLSGGVPYSLDKLRFSYWQTIIAAAARLGRSG